MIPICDVHVSLNGGIVIVRFHPRQGKVTRGEVNCHQILGCLREIYKNKQNKQVNKKALKVYIVIDKPLNNEIV